MSIELNAIRAIEVENVKLPGGLYKIDWDGESGQLVILGVRSWDQLGQLLPALAPGPHVLLAHNSKTPAAAVSQEAPPGRPPAAPPPAETPRQTAPADPGQRPPPPAAAPPAPRRPPLPVLAAPASNAVSQEGNGATRQDPTGVSVANPPVDGADMSIFGRLTKFEDIFDELVRRNEGANYVTIRNKVQLLMDTEMCPALDRLNKDGKLEERIKRRCAAKGVAGALDA